MRHKAHYISLKTGEWSMVITYGPICNIWCRPSFSYFEGDELVFEPDPAPPPTALTHQYLGIPDIEYDNEHQEY